MPTSRVRAPALGAALAHDATITAAATGSHVLLISIDGMHQADLERYVRLNPSSALAQLVGAGSGFSDDDAQVAGPIATTTAAAARTH